MFSIVDRLPCAKEPDGSVTAFGPNGSEPIDPKTDTFFNFEKRGLLDIPVPFDEWLDCVTGEDVVKMNAVADAARSKYAASAAS